jgi:peptidoglycan-associated lipoprotein
VGDRVFFELNSSTLNDSAQATLDKQAAWLAKYPNVTVQIAGNCDDRGTEEFNIALGNRRAKAAQDFLVAKGVSSSRISVISYGKDRPTALGDNEEAWSQNRNDITSVK